MTDDAQAFPHLAFFEALAGMEESSADWRAVSAGLVVLRLVDAWAAEGRAIVAEDAWGVRAVRAAIEDMHEGTPERSLLASVVDAVTSAPTVDVGLIAPRLTAYARALDFAGKLALAADVYRTTINYLDPRRDPDLAVETSFRLGYCSRSLGQWEQASLDYEQARRFAVAAGDANGIVRVAVGEAMIAVGRGNLPEADRILIHAIGQANLTGAKEGRGLAHHARAAVAHYGGRHSEALQHAHEALRDLASPQARDRVLADIAALFAELGLRDAARDAHLLLAATAQEQSSRWTSAVNLLEISVLDRREPVFEQYRRELASAPLPPALAGAFHLYVGRGHQTFGRLPEARSALERAAGIAEAHTLNELSFRVERALRDLDRAPVLAPAVSASIPAEVHQVAAAVREMRVLAGVSG